MHKDIMSTMDRIREEQLKNANKNPMPSILEMGKNLVETVADSVAVVASGETLSITEQEAKRRLSICESCEFYRSSRCTKCGCYMAAKTYLRAAKCPINKW